MPSLIHYFFIIGDNNNIFAYNYCENDRLWRKLLALTPDRYQKQVQHQFDECNNAFTKPHAPVFLNYILTQGLHKKADFAGSE